MIGMSSGWMSVPSFTVEFKKGCNDPGAIKKGSFLKSSSPVLEIFISTINGEEPLVFLTHRAIAFFGDRV
jgi:hypothetical protein